MLRGKRIVAPPILINGNNEICRECTTKSMIVAKASWIDGLTTIQRMAAYST